jgi:hypothetical protein
MPTLAERLQHGWNAFINNKDPTTVISPEIYVGSTYYRPDRVRLSRGHERSIINSIYNRMAEDVASVNIQHVQTDDNGRFSDAMKSGLNNVLTTEANLDQTGRAFIRDVVMSMFDEGVVACVPVDTSVDPDSSNSYDILTMRTGRITQWRPNHVTVELYNERTGKKQEVTLNKKMVAIIENPFYSIMNEPNSTLQRLVRKLNLLDTIDEQSSSGKLDLIIQLPYVIKTEARRQQAEQRRSDIEQQLTGSKYGIAYTDGTERIVQLNRPIENNLMKQIEYLTETLMSQLGITNEILNGTANESTMMNYYNRVIEPILSAIAGEFNRKFLTKTARTRGQTIMFFRDPFKLVPVANIADIADKFTRNAILTSNEVRGIIGFKPSQDPKADELSNKNLKQPQGEEGDMPPEEYEEYDEDIELDDSGGDSGF